MLSATKEKTQRIFEPTPSNRWLFFISHKNRPTVAIIQTLPYFSNQHKPVALILQIVRERFIFINTSRNTANKPYLFPPKSTHSS